MTYHGWYFLQDHAKKKLCIFYSLLTTALLFVLLLHVIYSCNESQLRSENQTNVGLCCNLVSRESERLKRRTVATAENENKFLSRKKRTNSRSCTTMHIALVCGGYNSTRSFYVLLKSILFYRTDIIHLHLLVDRISHEILVKLFETWTVPDLIVDYYNASDYEHEIAWIPSRHYSHRFGLMKLIFLTVLRDHGLSTVLLLDTDLLVLGNIKKVWKESDIFLDADGSSGNATMFGMVENQSEWYLGDNMLSKGQSVWPAIGRGYNSGVILVNLVELERQNWRQTWRQVTETELISHLSTSLADQDIFNAVIRFHKHIVHKLPCSFNIQLNDHTDLDEVCPDKDDFQIVHWNSPYKLESKNLKTEYYKIRYLTFRNWEGKLLGDNHCNYLSKSRADSSHLMDKTQSNLDVNCQAIRPRPDEKLRTFLYFLDFEIEPIDNDVTLVVHLSLDRLQVLDELAFQWRGPISAALYLSELETNLFLESVRNSENLARRKNIGYHLAFRDHGFNYPINKLRNIALKNAITPYVFLSDIDFLPQANLYDYLRLTITEMTTRNGVNPLAKRALVVPAFENLQYKFDFPSNKIELLTQLNMGSVSVFRGQIWPQGQAATDYARWRTSTKPYRVEWEPEYEPFVVTSRDVPNFDERFVGFGWNKVEHIMQLAALDYEFLVLPEAFMIHKFHSASYDIMQHRESFKYRSCIKQKRRIFLTELYIKFPVFFRNHSAISLQRSTTEPNA